MVIPLGSVVCTLTCKQGGNIFRERETERGRERKQGVTLSDLNPGYTGKGSIADAAEKRRSEHHH